MLREEGWAESPGEIWAQGVCWMAPAALRGWELAGEEPDQGGWVGVDWKE